PDDALAGEAGFAGEHRRGAAERREAAFGRDRHRVAPPFQPLAEQLLAPAFGVAVGGVDRVEARLESGVEDAPRFGVVGMDALHEARRLAERHRPEAQRADFQAAAAVVPMFHRRVLRARAILRCLPTAPRCSRPKIGPTWPSKGGCWRSPGGSTTPCGSG